MDDDTDSYARPDALPEALAILARAQRRPAIVAGATDHYPVEASRAAWMQPHGGPVIDISRIAGLRAITAENDGWRIGALATWTDLIDWIDHLAEAAPSIQAGAEGLKGLRQAARQVGGVQIQNRGTLGGNLCNASPAADGVPPLLALDAEVELARLSGTRRLPLADFILGNRRTALEPDELLTAIIVPRPAVDERSIFLKLGARSYLVISIASVAVNLRLSPGGRIAAAWIAVGACAAVPLRLPRLEQALVGQRPQAAHISLAEGDGISPIDDIRASAAYRRDAVVTLLRRALVACSPAATEAAA